MSKSLHQTLALPPRILGFLLGVLGTLLYLGTWGHGFVLDDVLAFTDNEFVQQGIDGIPSIFKNAYLYGFDGTTDESYRPIPLAINALQVELFGVQPFSGHVINTLLYGLICWLLFWLFYRITKQKWVSLIAALLFTVHPVHAEVVSNIKSGDELLGFLFVLLAFHSFLKSSWKFWIAGSLFLFLGALSKETALTFALIIPLSIYYLDKGQKLQWKPLLFAGIPILAYLALRSSILESVTFSGENLKVLTWNNGTLASDAWTDQLGTAVVILGKYLQLLILPWQLSSDYSFAHFPITSVFSFEAIAIGLVYLLLVAMAIRSLKNKHLWGIGIWWFLLALAPTSNVFIKIAATAGERFLFMPSAGFLLFAILFLYQFKERLSSSKLVTAAVVIVSLLFSVKTVSRAADWSSNGVLFATDIEKVPNSAKLNLSYAVELVEQAKESSNSVEQRKLYAKSLPYFEKSIEVLPTHHTTYREASNAFAEVKQYQRATEYLVQYLKMRPNEVGAWNNLARLYIDTKQWDKAKKVLDKCEKLDPEFVLAHYNRGSYWYNLESYDKAIDHFQKYILNSDEDLGKAYFYLGMSHFFNDSLREAIIELHKVSEESDYYAEALTGLGLCQHVQGKLEKAIDFYERALEIEPNNQAVLPNLISAYRKAGYTEKAAALSSRLKN